MTPFLLLALGMAIVLSLVIWLKLHPFLALTFAAVVVSFSTPQASLDNYAENHTRSQIDRGKMTEPKANHFKFILLRQHRINKTGLQEPCINWMAFKLLITLASLLGRGNAYQIYVFSQPL